MNGSVFISYSHGSDTRYVEELAAFLAEADIPTWFDRNMSITSRWASEIIERIDECAALVAILTPEAMTSQWVITEVGHAVSIHKPVILLALRAKAADFPIYSHVFQIEEVPDGRMPSFKTISALARLTEGRPVVRETDAPAVRATPRVRADTGHRALTGHTGAINCVKWSPDGRLVATAGDDENVIIWDPYVGQSVQTLSQCVGGAVSIDWSSASDLIAVAGAGGELRISDVLTGKTRSSVGYTARALAWSPRGNLVATISGDELLTWTVPGWERAAKAHLSHDLIRRETAFDAVAWHPNGNRILATGTFDGSYQARWWQPHLADAFGFINVPGNFRVDHVDFRGRTVHRGNPSGISFSPDAYLIAIASRIDGRAGIFPLTNDPSILPSTIFDGARTQSGSGKYYSNFFTAAGGSWLAGHAVAWSPQGRMIATARGGFADPLALPRVPGDPVELPWIEEPTGSWIELTDISTALPRRSRLDGHEGYVADLSWSPDGRMLACGGSDKLLHLWDVGE